MSKTWIIAVPLLYVVSYLVNSSTGGYYWLVVNDGTGVYGPSGSRIATSVILWQPRIGHGNGDHSGLLGYVYRPLIQLDRRLWHPKIDASKMDRDYFSRVSKLRVRDIHPETHDEFVTAGGTY
jgi:hypothetical protein